MKKKSREWVEMSRNFVEAALELYLNGSVDQAYEVAAMDEKINHYLIVIRDLATVRNQEKS